MRILTILLLVCGLAFPIHAGNERTIDWEQTVVEGVLSYGFEGAQHQKDSKLPLFVEAFKPELPASSYKVRILFPVFEQLNSDEVSALGSECETLADSITVSTTVGWERKTPVLRLAFLPLVKHSGGIYRLVSFRWDVVPATGKRLTAASVQQSAGSVTYAASSLLAKGKWRKISVTESGVYKLTYQQLLDMGLNPAKAQVYGYGGKLLEENFSKSGYIDDLPPVAVYRETGSDGIFNTGDYLLFYAQGPVSWTWNSSRSIFTRTRNHYSDKAYYLVGEREEGTLTTVLAPNDGTPNREVASFTDRVLHETEKVNMGESVASAGTGRELYGEDFETTTTQTFPFILKNPDRTTPWKINTEFTAHNTGTSYVYVYVNGVRMNETLGMGGISVSDNYSYGTYSNVVSAFTPIDSSLQEVQLDYVPNGNSRNHRACLNYLILTARRKLKMDGSVMSFRDPSGVGASMVARYSLSGANASTRVFEVTDPGNMLEMNGEYASGVFTFVRNASTLREFVAVDLSGSIPSPKLEGNVPNQNLHGLSGIDMVILAPTDFLPSAHRLAKAHQELDGLVSLVVTPEQVYNEFSSGTPDATAYRRLMKLYYDRATTEEEMPRYLLLFGDGVYDNRMVSNKFASSASSRNFLLTFQYGNSLSGSSSYVTDDYFGFLDDSEGANLEMDQLDIGIGRFPVSSVKEAEAVVDKTIAYMKNARKGAWKNRLLFIGDNGDDFDHEYQSNYLASSVEANQPEFMVNRIFMDTYNSVTTQSGARAPDAKKRLEELLESGLLMLNYTGHGSTTQWTHEMILTIDDVRSMTNQNLPLWVTATCDFTRYDAYDNSGGEEVFLNAKGGGIALFTTTRVVYSSNNFVINKAFIQNIFAKNNGVRYALGDIMNLSKCDASLRYDSNKLSFTLIGDPAIKLAYPEYRASVTRLNGSAVTTGVDTIPALSTVTVEGEVYREDGSLADDFNGLLYPTVQDAAEVIGTFQRDSGSELVFRDRNKVLFSGKDSVVNGRFSFSFVVPKDISYSYKTGSINLYAHDEAGRNEAQGSFAGFTLGGTAADAPLDASGPVLTLALNDWNFRNGGTVNEVPTFLARLSDDNGLNTAGSGIGHDLTLVVDGDPSLSFNLNGHFRADLGSYTSGVVAYPLPELAEGSHTLTFRAWDVLNNSGSDTLRFVVQKGLKPRVSNVRFVQKGGSGWFVFDHDRPDVDVVLQVSIYDLTGRLMWNKEQTYQSESVTSEPMEWNFTDTSGRTIGQGLYLCKVLMTDSSGKQSYATEKIRFMGQ